MNVPIEERYTNAQYFNGTDGRRGVRYIYLKRAYSSIGKAGTRANF